MSIWFALTLACLPVFLCYESGAGTCVVDISDTSYMDGYGRIGGTNGFQFSLVSGQTSYTAGERITLSFGGGVQFKGVLMYFEDGGGSRQGVFDVASHPALHAGQGDDCFEDASVATHRSSSIKQAPFAVSWTAPASDQGTLSLRTLFLSPNDQFSLGSTLELTFRSGSVNDCTAESLSAACVDICGAGAPCEASCIGNQESITCPTPAPTPSPTPQTLAPSPPATPGQPTPVPTPFTGTPAPTPAGASRTLCEARPSCATCLVPGVDELSTCNWCTFNAVPGGIGECTTQTQGCSSGLQHYGIQTDTCDDLEMVSAIELLDVPCDERIQLQQPLTGEYQPCDGCFMSRLRPGECGWCLFAAADPAAQAEPGFGARPNVSPAGICMDATGGALECQMMHPGAQWSSTCPRCAARVCESCIAEAGCAWCRDASPTGSEARCFLDSSPQARVQECESSGGVVFDYTSDSCPETVQPTPAPSPQPTDPPTPAPPAPACIDFPTTAEPAVPICELSPSAIPDDGSAFRIFGDTLGFQCVQLTSGSDIGTGSAPDPWVLDETCADAIRNDGRDCALAIGNHMCSTRCIACGPGAPSRPCAAVCDDLLTLCPTATAEAASCLGPLSTSCLSLSGPACNNHARANSLGVLPATLEAVFATASPTPVSSDANATPDAAKPTPSPSPGPGSSDPDSVPSSDAAFGPRSLGSQELVGLPWYVFFSIALAVLILCAGGCAAVFFCYARSSVRAEERAFEEQTIALDAAEQKIKALREAKRKQAPTIRVQEAGSGRGSRSTSRRSSKAIPMGTIRGHAIKTPSSSASAAPASSASHLAADDVDDSDPEHDHAQRPNTRPTSSKKKRRRSSVLVVGADPDTQARASIHRGGGVYL